MEAFVASSRSLRGISKTIRSKPEDRRHTRWQAARDGESGGDGGIDSKASGSQHGPHRRPDNNPLGMHLPFLCREVRPVVDQPIRRRGLRGLPFERRGGTPDRCDGGQDELATGFRRKDIDAGRLADCGTNEGKGKGKGKGKRKGKGKGKGAGCIVIYFIQNTVTKAVKIGTSNDPSKRIASFQTAIAEPLEILGVIPGDRHLERRLHIRFSGFHIRGEWFRGDDILLKGIRDILAASTGHPNLWDECERRGRCRFGLGGVKVTVIGEQFISTIGHSFWNSGSELMVHLNDGRKVPARQCVLRSEWPDHETANLDSFLSIIA